MTVWVLMLLAAGDAVVIGKIVSPSGLLLLQTGIKPPGLFFNPQQITASPSNL